MPSAYLWLFWLSDPEGHYNQLQSSAWMQGAFFVCGIWPVLTSDCSAYQILKDVTTCYKFLRGCRVCYVWDMPGAYLWLFCLSDPEGHYNPLQISAWMQSALCAGYAQCLPLIDWLFCLLDLEGHYNPLQTSAWAQSAFCVGYAQCLPLIVLSDPEGHYNPLQTSTWMQSALCAWVGLPWDADRNQGSGSYKSKGAVHRLHSYWDQRKRSVFNFFLICWNFFLFFFVCLFLFC